MGTYGYCAPEYAMSGKLTLKSDIYSFGVVLLELITGCKVIDCTKKPGEQNLIVWDILQPSCLIFNLWYTSLSNFKGSGITKLKCLLLGAFPFVDRSPAGLRVMH
ncbi:unnamed protein product [Fraxinus pennsylvanica]|uniref:Protein kinase domain-containing protein n=1 Tax=Fraxinus pennsylvanica TaxID=56036 RepID=A0AAD2AEA1_9LAMI|nr:unnamed protein product [Fraxinus pennsylvanica]